MASRAIAADSAATPERAANNGDPRIDGRASGGACAVRPRTRSVRAAARASLLWSIERGRRALVLVAKAPAPVLIAEAGK